MACVYVLRTSTCSGVGGLVRVYLVIICVIRREFEFWEGCGDGEGKWRRL